MAGGQPVRDIARWDGQQWHDVGGGLDRRGLAFTIFDDSLVIAGTFAQAGNRVVNGIAQWRDCNLDIQLDVAATCPGGGPVEVSWSGATPDANVAIIFAANTGNFAVPYGPCSGTRLGLGSQGIRLAATARSDSQGGGDVQGTIPANACGRYLQLLDLAACETSNVARIE